MIHSCSRILLKISTKPILMFIWDAKFEICSKLFQVRIILEIFSQKWSEWHRLQLARLRWCILLKYLYSYCRYLQRLSQNFCTSVDFCIHSCELYCILNPLRKKNYIKNDVGPIEKSPSWNLLSLANWSDERYEMFRCEIDYFRYAVCILQCSINDVQLRDGRRNEERGKGRDSMSKVTSL